MGWPRVDTLPSSSLGLARYTIRACLDTHIHTYALGTEMFGFSSSAMVFSFIRARVTWHGLTGRALGRLDGLYFRIAAGGYLLTISVCLWTAKA
ncbi:hypothetical protein F4778DRAFT_721573 [Xylariomycetidae sp. FL2044]|nr:hypothetical protein F4778DRAFT_721573 [Xylariomycetidae sp. FL2044]